MDKNTLLAKVQPAYLRIVAGAVARHRLADRRNPWTGQIPRHARLRLDCLDGVHEACESCACDCHWGVA